MSSFRASSVVTLLFLLNFLQLTCAQFARWGPGWHLGPARGAEIVRFETVYTPGKKEKNAARLIFNWPGMIDQSKAGRSDLIQTVTEASPSSRMECGAKPDQWCIAPFAMHGMTYPEYAKWKAINHDAKIKIIYSRASVSASTMWTQTTIDMKTNKVLHNFTRGKGVMKDIQFQTELQGSNKGTISDQFYVDSIITLSKADPRFGKTGRAFMKQSSKFGAASGTAAETKDGGKTWTIAKVKLPKMREGTAA